MKIAIIGATGKAGHNILQEALRRQLDVTAIVRNREKLTENVPVIEKEITQLTTNDIMPFDVVVNAFGAPAGNESLHVTVGRHLIDIFSSVNTRLIVVGGAGSLYTDDTKTVRIMDTPDFPEAYFATASQQGQNLIDLQQSTVNYTFLSPSAFFDAEDKRTGHYRVGQDVLLTDTEGNSYISYADYAIALVDEMENPQFIKQRFTVSRA
ncbi:hypothetical protein GCM10007425_11620 [Lysinibacillus alkalisoli]|uniref:NAD(P)-binding domain-containing protein n=1 Tax=Lysinibacillus alkalisoli TaxID=1911548 RepID=A0A917G1X6_9BACI|nr:NAD(P)-dependent oxidoreductase [Lysinibacillus alkalisoli]GGG18807.1 hypothetical protein GCM10007425_11620 [Lysinibacillus alkalisoli]